ncbi:MAG: hypothetical protein AMXMBFR13_02130, partial [Phycisphaerae bacterium]
ARAIGRHGAWPLQVRKPSSGRGIGPANGFDLWYAENFSGDPLMCRVRGHGYLWATFIDASS